MVAAPMTLLMPGAGPPATTMASLLGVVTVRRYYMILRDVTRSW